MAIGISHIFSQIAGSVGDTTYTRNRYSAIVLRQRVAPAYPGTGFQLTQTARLAAAMLDWQTRGTVDRASWENYAKDTPWNNKLGQDVRITGCQMYCAIRIARQTLAAGTGLANFDVAHCIPGMFPNVRAWYTEPSAHDPDWTGFRLFVQNTHRTNQAAVYVFISDEYPSSVNYFKGPYNPNHNLSYNTINPGQIKNLNFTGRTAGLASFLRLRTYDWTTKKRMSNYQYMRVISETGP